MSTSGRRTLAFALAVLQGHCSFAFAAAAIARDGESLGGPDTLLGGLWGTLDAAARTRLVASFESALADPAVAKSALLESGLADAVPPPGSLPAYAATVRPASNVRLPAGTARVSDSDRFDVRQEHARGGMGRILIAWDARLGREVAIKELLPGIGATVPADGGRGKTSMEEADRERFFREARVTGQLEHPNIVPVYEMGERDGAPFYAMRLIRGDTMAARIARIATEEKTPEGRLAARLRLLDAMLDVCNAVAYAHARGVVNRDIKPANVMLGDFGETFVLDWGLARVRGHEDRALTELKLAAETLKKAVAAPGLTLDGSILGTPAYMPPEQARGELDKVDERSDVYALGAILYEIVTGRPPFMGPHPVAVLQSVLRGELDAVTNVEPLAPRDLAAIVHRALQRDPAQRFQSALALADELRACRDGRPLTVYKYTGREQLARFVRRNRALSAALALAMTTLVAGTVVSLQQAHRASTESVAARQAEAETAKRALGEREALQATRAALRRAEGLRLAATSLTVIQDSPGVALSLAMEASARAPGAASNNAMLSALLELRELRRLIGHGFYVFRAAWSPSGTRVATCGSDFLALLWDADSGRLLQRFEGHRAPVHSVEFSPDGSRLLTTAEDGTARVWNVETGAEVARLGEELPVGASAAFHPRGHAVLTWQPRAAVWTLSGGVATPLEGLDGPALHAAWSPDGAFVAVASMNGEAGLWDAATGKRLRELTGCAGAGHLAFSPNGARLVAACRDGQARLHDPSTGALVLSVPVGKPVESVGFRFDGKQFGTCDEDDSLFWWNAADGSSAGPRIDGVKRFPWCLSPDGKRLARVRDAVIEILDSSTGEVLGAMRGHEYSVNFAAFDPEGRRVAAASSDITASIWDTMAGARLPRTPFPRGPRVRGIDARRGRLILARRDEDAAWCGPEGRLEPLSIPGVVPRIKDLIVAASHDVAALQNFEGTFHLVDLSAGRELGPWPAARGGRRVAIADDAPVVSFVEAGSTIVTLDAVTGRKFGSFEVTGDFVALVPASDGRNLLILNAPHGDSRFVDSATGEVRAEMRGHTGMVLEAVLLLGDRVAVTFAADATVRRWDLATGRLTAQHSLPRILSGSLVRSPDGRHVALVSEDLVRVLETEGLHQVFTLPADRPGIASFTPDSSSLLVPDTRGFLLRIPLDLESFARSVAPREIGSSEYSRFEIGDPADRNAAINAWNDLHPAGMREILRSQQAYKDGRADAAIRFGRRATESCPSYPDCWLTYSRALMLMPEGKRDAAEAVRALREYAKRGFATKKVVVEIPGLDALKGRPDYEELLRGLK